MYLCENLKHMVTINVNNKTTQVVREAMRIVSKDVRSPKVVREGTVKVASTTNVVKTK